MAKKQTRLEDLAKAAGVSTATVSRALNDNPNVNQETKKRVWKLAQEMGYAFRPSMPAILSGAAATIAVVIPAHSTSRDGTVSDPFYLELIGGVCDTARELGCDVLISHLAPQNFDDLSGLVASTRTNGFIFLGQSTLHERFNRLAETDARFVVWGADLPGQKYCSIGSDNVAGGRKATAHLIRLGRRRIVFMGVIDQLELGQRYQGYLAALAEAGSDYVPILTDSGHTDLVSAEAATEAMISQGVEFDAVFAGSDLAAAGAIRAIKRAGRRVPEDVAVVGYDNIAISRYNNPPLTTVSQDMAKAGRLMVSKLLNAARTTAALSERLPTELIVRESCGS